ncbi:MAG: hypothetical protein IKO52_11100 [Clostridia bacterium]|nr:hypothetical protein [Clostridia bacterium]
MQEGGEKTEQKKKLINAYGIAIPRVHALYGSITGFEVQGRRLYPAVEAARLFGYSFPNVAGSQCGRKELWNVEMTVSRADREKTFTTIVEKNFIPEEDVRRMAQRSKHPDADVILAWILGEERESDADEE